MEPRIIVQIGVARPKNRYIEYTYNYTVHADRMTDRMTPSYIDMQL